MIKLFVIFYILVGIFTTGLTYNKFFNEAYVDFKTPNCREVTSNICWTSKVDILVSSSALAVAAGIGWPIYYITYVTDFSNSKKE